MTSSSFFRIAVAVLLIFFTAAVCGAQKGSSMTIDRISVNDAQKLIKNGDALLVCSYSDSRCKEILLEGAILLSEFESTLPSLPKTQPIIFYCA
jgi:hypothetical protein